MTFHNIYKSLVIIHKIVDHHYFLDDMNLIDLHLMIPYLKYTGTLEDIRTRNLMFTVAGPYLKNRSTKPKDMMPLAIDDDATESHTPETSISAKQVDWYEKNKAMFEHMMLPNEQK